jgi:microcystin synthetase protein McyJ
VLDVGCGGGASTLDLARLSAASEVVGIDITRELLENARADARRSGSQRVRFEQVSATRLTFPDQSFERVVAIDCASHFATREDFFVEAARVLCTQGRITLLDLVLGTPPARFVDRVLLWLLVRGWRLPRANCHDAKGYIERLQRTGFRSIEAEDVSHQVLPGATRHMLSESYQSAFVAEFGRARAALWRVVLAAIARAERAGLVKFILVTAERS